MADILLSRLIRVVGIEASNRCLLKGHGGSVSDLELLAGTGGSDHILGSIAKVRMCKSSEQPRA